MPTQGEETLWRVSPELEPTHAYRLGIDVEGGWRSPRKVTGWKNPQGLLR
jgi:hypothetical protein